MEHLPPVARLFDPVFVPYIGDREYDGLDFSEYPTRRGYNLDLLLEGDFQGSSPSEIASFVQVWLWFGLIHGILGVQLDAATFIRVDDSGRKWLNTKPLVSLLQTTGRLVDQEKDSPEYTPEIEETRNVKIESVLHTAYRVWEGFARLEYNYSISSPLSPEVSFGIQVLAITLHVGATQLLFKPSAPGGAVYRQVAPWERGLHIRLTKNPWLDERMYKQGWCPLMVEQIRTSSNVIGQYYSSLLGPPLRKLDHSRCKKTSNDCVAMQNLPLVKVGHELDNCTCKTLLVDRKKLADIIAKDEIPVLQLVEVNGEEQLDVLSSSSIKGLEYTAMSHVWSDGWGNANENSLPACRVHKLVETITATYSMPDFSVHPAQGEWYRPKNHDSSVYFWIDTLCVPREPSHIHSRAIIQMRDVYTFAERVLVFDSELMSSTSHALYEELHMRVSNSRWIRRLWTLQEAVLAKRLIFQFKEGPHLFMTGSQLWHQRRKDLELNYYNTVGWDCNSSFYVAEDISPGVLMRQLWLLFIVDRAVTVQSDEPICGAILMGYDMKRLMEAPEEKRMHTFWQLHSPHLPLAILFVASPRLSTPGFRWAPTSLLPCQKAGLRFQETGSVTDEGFKLKIPAHNVIKFSTPEVLGEGVDVFPVMVGGCRYFVRKSPVELNPGWEGLELHRREGLAVVLELPAAPENGTYIIDGSRAALVSVTTETNSDGYGEGDKEEVITAEYLRLVSLIKEGSSFHRYPSLAWTKAEVEQGAREPCLGEWIGEEREWCFT